MSFHSGRVTFCRFRTVGDRPTSVDETALSLLRESAFRETPIGAPDEVEVGWVTGEHILDTQFAFEKNGFGAGFNRLLFAMRIDTHKVPADLRKAYRKMNEQAAAEASPTGFASKLEKRDASEIAERQVREDLAAGKFRRSKMVPVLWDLEDGTVYCGATGTTILEHLTRLFRESFAVELQPITAGSFVSRALQDEGRTRDYEDLKPTPFTDPPTTAADRASDDEEFRSRDVNIPSVPWTSKSVDMKDFVGNEFLIWLWWACETTHEPIECRNGDGRSRQLVIGLDRVLDMDCAWDTLGRQSLRADAPTRLREAAEALITGKWPRKVGILLADGEHHWQFTLQADQMAVSAALLPEVEGLQTPREVLESRLELAIELSHHLNALYARFLHSRCNGSWDDKRSAIRTWIHEREQALVS